jgi:hypothetical protein
MEELSTMAKKVTKVGEGQASGAWTVFVNYAPPTDVEEWLAKHYPTPNETWAALDLLLTTGYKVSFSRNQTNGAIICSMTCRNVDSENNGKTLTSFAGDWYDSLRVACLKHFELLKCSWTQAEASVERPKFG